MDDQNTEQPTTPSANPPAPSNFPPKTSEDDLLQSASVGMVEAEQEQPTPPPTRVTTGAVTKSRKKLWIALLIIVLLGAIGGGVYTLFIKNDSSKENNTIQPVDDMQENTKATLNYEPDLVAYLHRDNQSEPNTLFSRPAIGGERKEALKFQQDESTTVSDIRGQEVIIASDTKLYASHDGGRKYDVIYTHDTTDVIVSVKISADGSRIAFGTVPSVEGAPGNDYYGAIYSINLEGKDKQQITNSKEKALLILNWNAKDNKIVYSEGCYYCEGARTAYKLHDIKAKKAEDLLPGKDVSLFHYGLEVSSDLTRAIYVQAPTGVSVMESVPPYQVRIVNLEDMEDTLVQTVGSKDEKNPNGTARFWDFSLGFLAGSNVPYYATDKSLYKVVDGEATLILTSDMLMSRIYYASEKQLVYGSRESQGGEALFLNHYDIAKEVVTQIFEGDNNTLVFGVSTN